MPLPVTISTEEVTKAVTAVLIDNKVIPKRTSALEAFEDAGCDVRMLATQLATLVLTARDSTRLKAIITGFNLHGINLTPELGAQVPDIIFNIEGDNAQVNQMFAPERKINVLHD